MIGAKECCGVIVSFGPTKSTAYIVTTKPLSGMYGLDVDGTHLRMANNTDAKMKDYYTATKESLNKVSKTTYSNVYVYKNQGEAFSVDAEINRMGAKAHSLVQTPEMIAMYAPVYESMAGAFGSTPFEMTGFRKTSMSLKYFPAAMKRMLR